MQITTIAAALLGLGACTTADYADGVNGFSQAVGAAAALAEPLATAAQEAQKRQMLQMLPKTQPTTVSLSQSCLGVDPVGYHAGDCAVTIGGVKLNYAGVPPNMVSLTRYAASLSAVVTATTCNSVQTAAKGLAAAAADLASAAGANKAAAAAGPISTIAGVAACSAIEAEQIRILRTGTMAANPLVKAIVPSIADAYQQFYVDAINDAFNQTTAALISYQTAARSYEKSRSAADLAQETASLTQADGFAAAIDKAKAAPQPGPVVNKIATLHQALTDDLQSPTINLKRVLNDAQIFVTEATTVTSAAQALDAVINPPTPAAKPAEKQAR
ncbi:hypothetical protein [Acidisphaera sp. S103]|uniref:hypothetical protein n=1 Tax=Acidisphaera sp. S103 TaxID=1747223 RepID=UPI00131DB329|nr:hypothetical protein [Acidisphaera sp. S103]